MILLNSEIEKFLQHSKVSVPTLAKYTKYLSNFSNFLSNKLNKSMDEIDLEQIYTVKDKQGVIIAHKSLDSKILDEFFSNDIKCNYYQLIVTSYALSGFFKYLKNRYGFKNPMIGMTFDFKSLKPYSRPPKVLTRHEILKLFHVIISQSCHFERDVLLFTLLFSTGCRISEILNLKIKEISFELDSFKLLKTKNGKQRIVVMLQDLGKEIKTYCEKNKLTELDNLITDEYGRPFTIHGVTKLLHNYCKMAGIKKINVHVTRHSFATVMFDSGSELAVIQQLLGQNKLDITKKYIHSNYVRNTGIVIKENLTLYQKINLKHIKK